MLLFMMMMMMMLRIEPGLLYHYFSLFLLPASFKNRLFEFDILMKDKIERVKFNRKFLETIENEQEN